MVGSQGGSEGGEVVVREKGCQGARRGRVVHGGGARGKGNGTGMRGPNGGARGNGWASKKGRDSKEELKNGTCDEARIALLKGSEREAKTS